MAKQEVNVAVKEADTGICFNQVKVGQYFMFASGDKNVYLKHSASWILDAGKEMKEVSLDSLDRDLGSQVRLPKKANISLEF